MATHGHCHKCKCNHPISAPAVGKIVGGLAGSLLGGSTKNPLAAVIGAIGGVVIGEVFDREVLPRCPACGTILQILAAAI